MLFLPNYLIYINFIWYLYINLDILKENGFDTIIYHIRDENKIFAGLGANLPGIFTLKKTSETGSFPSKSDI